MKRPRLDSDCQLKSVFWHIHIGVIYKCNPVRTLWLLILSVKASFCVSYNVTHSNNDKPRETDVRLCSRGGLKDIADSNRSTLKHAVCSATCDCLESETIDQSCVVRVQIYWRLRLHQSNQCRCDLITHRSERLCLSHPIWGTNWILLLTEHQLRSSYSYNQSNVSDLQTAVLKPNRPNQLLINHTDMRVLLTSEWLYHTKCLYIPLK